jgi:hypothetical protein
MSKEPLEQGTDELDAAYRKATPGQTVKEAEKICEEDPCWKGYRQFGTKEKDGKKVPNCIPEKTAADKLADIADLRKLLANPDTERATKNYGSVSAYKNMLRGKINNLMKKENVSVDLSENRRIAIVSLCTGSRNIPLIESFLSVHDITGRENDILGIRTDFQRFSNQ